MTHYETIIGLEVHAQLLTASKMFCGCSADYASAAPNTHVCPVCMALPGVLPVINRVAAEVQGRVQIVEGDMRSFDLGQQFALATIPFRLVRCGYEVEALYADYHKRPYGSQYPGELIFVGRRPLYEA